MFCPSFVFKKVEKSAQNRKQISIKSKFWFKMELHSRSLKFSCMHERGVQAKPAPLPALALGWFKTHIGFSSRGLAVCYFQFCCVLVLALLQCAIWVHSWDNFIKFWSFSFHLHLIESEHFPTIDKLPNFGLSLFLPNFISFCPIPLICLEFYLTNTNNT